MKILLLCHEYPPVGGGGGVGAKEYAEAWASKGNQVTVITSRFQGLKSLENVGGVDVVRVFAPGGSCRATVSFVSMAFYCLSGLVHILLRFRTYQRYDVINTHFALPTGVLGTLVRKMLKKPCVLTIIGGDIFDPTKRTSPHRIRILRFLNNKILNSADEVVAISKDTKRRAKEFYSVHKRIQVIHYGFVPREFREDRSKLNRARESFQLIAVGRLVERKGFDHLIRALTRLPGDIVLDIVGDGPLEMDLKNLIREFALEDRVRLLGFRTRFEIHRLLRAADCFVLSSLHEGLGIVVQEAMYAGLPIVSTDNGGQMDLLKEARNAFLVPPGDPDLLAAAILKVYSSPEVASKLADNNRCDIRKLLIGAKSEEYLNLFRFLIDASNFEALQDAKGVRAAERKVN